MKKEVETALDNQVDGDHYKSLRVQPVHFCEINELTSCQSSIVRYITRHKAKNGRVDIEKAIHYAELMIQMANPSWILELPMTKPGLLQRYACGWPASRRCYLGRSIARRAESRAPVYLPMVYAAAIGLDVEETKALMLICYEPGPIEVEQAIEAMKGILARDYEGGT